MLDFNENEFHFTEPPWFIGPEEHPSDLSHLCRLISRVSKEDRSCVAAFSDDDLGRRFIAWQAGRHEGAKHLAPFQCKTKENLIQLLFMLSGMGVTHVGIDPEKGRPVKRISTANFVKCAFG